MKQKSFTPTESGNGPSPSGGIWTILSRQATAIWIFAILISVLVFGLIQPPWPDPTNPPAAFRSIDWWRYPIERNREMKLPYLQGTLTNIAAPRDSADVWIAGADTLIHSPDNGKTWEQLPVPDPPIASEEKRISGTSSGDSSDPKSDMAQRPVKPSDPRALAPELRFSVESIDFLDDKIGWITIHNRAENTVHLYRTADAGATWDGPYEFPEPLMEWNPRFVTADEGVTQADEDIYYTDDGGNTWSMVYDADLENPGGRYNLSDRIRPALSLDGILFCVDPDGRITRSGTNGKDWEDVGSIELPISQYLIDMVFTDKNTGWILSQPYAVNSGIEIHHTMNGGKNWTREWTGPKGTFSPLRMEFASRTDGWLIADSGLYRTLDGAWNDEPQLVLAEGNPLLDLAFSMNGHGWAVGEDGLILKTTNGGEDWFRVSRTQPGDGTYRKLPAPWFWAFLFVGLVYGGSRVHKNAGIEPGDETRGGSRTDNGSAGDTGSTEEKRDSSSGTNMESDAAIESKEFDMLNFGPLVECTSDFLRNLDTQPGLTMAITGNWGSGKTSFMNLLSIDLRKKGYRPVFFNAWHHQKEDNILLSILEAVRTQAVPSVWTIDGLVFRLRLIYWRFLRSPFKAMVIPTFFVFLASTVFLATRTVPHPVEKLRESEIVNSLTGIPYRWALEFHEREPAQLFSPKTIVNSMYDFAQGTVKQYEADGIAALIALAALGIVLTFLFKWTHIYAVNPVTNALSSVSRWVRLKDLEARTDSRERFLRTFKDITQAMGEKRRMTIFIDDLDRCGPKHVVRSLESINYLTAYGDSYIILGVAWQQLRDSLATGFKMRGSGESSGEKGKSKYVDNYMKKLIQIAFQIPDRSPEEKEKIRTELEERKKQGKGARDDSSKKNSALHAIKWVLNFTFIPASVTVLLMSAIIFGGPAFYESLNDDSQTEITGRSNSPEQFGETSLPSAGTVPDVVPGTIPEDVPVVVFKPGQLESKWNSLGLVWSDNALRYAVLVIVFITNVSLFVTVFRLSGVETSRDSETFADALKLWSALVYKRDSTPRADKRFRNQARFLANMIHALQDRSTTAEGEAEKRDKDEHATIILTAMNFYHEDLGKVDALVNDSASLQNVSDGNAYSQEMTAQIDLRRDTLKSIHPDFTKLASAIYQVGDETPIAPLLSDRKSRNS